MVSLRTALLLGCVLVYLINILINFYEKHDLLKAHGTTLIRIRRPVCMMAAYLTLLLLVILVVDSVVPKDMQTALGSVDWKSRMDQMICVFQYCYRAFGVHFFRLSAAG